MKDEYKTKKQLIDGLVDLRKRIIEISETERKKAEETIRESEERYHDLFNNAHDMIQSVVPDGHFIFVNPAWLKTMGYTWDELQKLNIFDIVHPCNKAHCMENFQKVMSGKPIDNIEAIFVTKDGRQVYVEGSVSVRLIDGKVVASHAILRDVTEQKRAEEEIQRSYDTQTVINSVLRLTQENVPLEELLKHTLDLILSIKWLSLESKGSMFLIEDSPEVLVMKVQKNLAGPVQKECARVLFGRCLCGRAALRQEIQFTDCFDERHEIRYEGMSSHSHYCVPIIFGGKTLGVINLYLNEGHSRDQRELDFLTAIANTLAGIIMRKKAEDRIEYLAYYDALTGLPNRTLFADRLKQGLARADFHKRLVAVLVIDIDRFKSINDTYGTEIGDRVLKEVAGRLSASVREGDTVARLGSDEFGIVLVDVAHSGDIVGVVEKIMKNASQTIKFDEKEIVITLSIGISVCPDDGKDVNELIKNAELAFSKAKQQGRKTYQFYTADMNVKASEFVLMEKHLFNALKNDEFILYYQPYWDINTKNIAGMEALLRWQSREFGLVSPGKFIPVLEETGLIIDVGEWILKTACRQVIEWHDKGHQKIPVSVNLSLIQFRQKDLTEMLERIIRESGVDPKLLTMEITESTFMQDVEFTSSVLKKIKDMGISISIDDFGTGYSSLSYLKRLPVDNLKIDISFIRDIATDPDAASIVTAIISMAHTLNLKTIAEGVETEEQWKILRLLRCDMGQGYYYSKPLPAEDAEKMLIYQK